MCRPRWLGVSRDVNIVSAETEEASELLRRLRVATGGDPVENADSYRRHFARYGNPFIQTPDGLIVRPSLRGL